MAVASAPLATSARVDCWCSGPCETVECRFTHTADGWAMACCAVCGTARLVPPPNDATLAAAYAADYYGPGRRKFRGPVGRLFAGTQDGRARWATRLRRAPGTLLDVGCGSGDFLVAMQRRGWTVVGTERDAARAAQVERDRGLPVHAGDLADLPLGPGRVDMVSLWHVLEHLHDPLGVLTRAHDLLAPDGILLLAIPNLDSWQARTFGRHWFHHDPPRHLWAFGRRGLLALLARAGFAPLRVRTFSLEQNPYGVLQSALNAAGFPRDRAYDLLKGVPQGTRATRLLDLALLAGGAAPAVAAAVVEAALRRGGTLNVAAVRVDRR